MTKVRAPNSLPSSLYANKPTESTAAEPQARCEATRHERSVLSLVFLVGETYRLLARTEGSRDHERSLSAKASPLCRQCSSVRPKREVRSRARRAHCFSRQSDDHEGRRAS